MVVPKKYIPVSKKILLVAEWNDDVSIIYSTSMESDSIILDMCLET